MPAPLHLTLEFARAESAGQPHGFRFAAQTYLLRSPDGGFEAAEFPWTHALLADLRALRASPPDPAIAHRIGDVLRAFLGPTGFAAHEQAIVDAARAGAAILVTIRSAAAELYALPWELLVLKGPGQMLGGIPRLVVRYEWPQTATYPDSVPPARRCGRVLFAWSAAGGGVPAADHLAALRTHHPQFDPGRDVLAHASFAAIAEALAAAAERGPPIDVLHLLCHGAASGATYGLTLDDPDAGKSVVDAGRVQQLFAPHAGMLRAVVVAACDSGNVGEPGNHLGSVAQMIHRAGLRAVVASRFPLSAAGSSRFAAALFAALADRECSLERAFATAREVLVRDPNQLDWASVQLYARAADGDATRPFARDLAATPRPGRKLAAGLAGAAALALALGAVLWPAGEPPAEPATVVPGPASVPPSDAAHTLAARAHGGFLAIQTLAAARGRTLVTPPANPDVGEAPAVGPTPPSGTPTRPPKPGCRAAPGECSPEIVRHVGGPLGVQPSLRITVSCKGGINYKITNQDRETEAAKRARDAAPDLDSEDIRLANITTLPCIMRYP